MSEYYIVKYIDGEPIRIKSDSKNSIKNKMRAVNGCVNGPPCPTCAYSHGQIYGCVAPNVYCSKQTGTPCPGWP